jgi:hypothetical protein
MLVFYNLYTKDKNKGHEVIAIELALSAVFAYIRQIRPFAIVIDKHKTSINFINNVIYNDIHYWNFMNATKVQIAEIIFLCHFHVIKA